MRSKPLWRAITSLAFTVPTAALAVPITYQGNLTQLNDSGVSGTATLVLREDINKLDVTINASGLEPNQLHVQHIHGRFNAAGEPINSTSPTSAQDTNNDGFVSLSEGLVTYGPIIVPLDPFPTAPDGTVSFMQTYDLLAESTYFGDFTVDDLLPLVLREIVLHGAFVDPNEIVDPDGVIRDDGYLATLPVASGAIFQVSGVPEPSTIWLLLIGFAATALGLRGRSQDFRA